MLLIVTNYIDNLRTIYSGDLSQIMNCKCIFHYNINNLVYSVMMIDAYYLFIKLCYFISNI